LGAFKLGYAVPDRERKIVVKPKGLVGGEGKFWKV